MRISGIQYNACCFNSSLGIINTDSMNSWTTNDSGFQFLIRYYKLELPRVAAYDERGFNSSLGIINPINGVHSDGYWYGFNSSLGIINRSPQSPVYIFRIRFNSSLGIINSFVRPRLSSRTFSVSIPH